MNSIALKTGDTVEVTTVSLAYGGEAVARHQGLAIFIPLAAPGERLRVTVTERHKNYARAVISEILLPSLSRREPPCRFFGECGGCQIQHLDYPAQLEAKTGFVRDALARIGGIDWPHPIEIRSAAEFSYRTRAQVKLQRVRSQNSDQIRIGFNRPASHSVCDVDSCPILVDELNRALHSLRSAIRENPDQYSRLSEVEIAAGDSGVSCNPRVAGMYSGPINRRVADCEHELDAATFFQPNAALLEPLLAEAARGRTGGLAFDLYAGVGFFTLQLAHCFARVIGVESDAHASQLALRNIEINGRGNIEFHTSRVDHFLSNLSRRRAGGESPRPDLALLDPPRQGAAEAVGPLIELAPERITYVSCDPTTLARDLRRLIAAGYDLSAVIAFDLFPQTYHVETVAHLARRL